MTKDVSVKLTILEQLKQCKELLKNQNKEVAGTTKDLERAQKELVKIHAKAIKLVSKIIGQPVDLLSLTESLNTAIAIQTKLERDLTKSAAKIAKMDAKKVKAA